jgi:hypothetical protein
MHAEASFSIPLSLRLLTWLAIPARPCDKAGGEKERFVEIRAAFEAGPHLTALRTALFAHVLPVSLHALADLLGQG